MGSTIKIVAGVLVLVVLAGGAFLTFSDISAPVQEVERKLPNDRFFEE